MVIGRARRCRSGKATWTLSHCAWKPAKRSVMVWKRWRTASRWSSPFLSRKSARLLETSSLADEVRYIQRRAADYDGRIFTVGQLVLFSTETGDAWLLDPADRLPARLAPGGEERARPIQGTHTT